MCSTVIINGLHNGTTENCWNEMCTAFINFVVNSETPITKQCMSGNLFGYYEVAKWKWSHISYRNEQSIVTCQPIVGLRNSGCSPLLSASKVNRFLLAHDDVILQQWGNVTCWRRCYATCRDDVIRHQEWGISCDLYVSKSDVTYPPAATVA
jgi:hypothetical protein